MKIPFPFMMFLVASVSTVGCGPQIECKDLERRLDRCGVEVYLSVAAPEAGFVETLISDKSGLSADARVQVARLWQAEKKRLTDRFVADLKKKCARDKGRYRESKDLNRCLNIKDCQKFAECFRRAVRQK